MPTRVFIRRDELEGLPMGEAAVRVAFGHDEQSVVHVRLVDGSHGTGTPIPCRVVRVAPAELESAERQLPDAFGNIWPLPQGQGLVVLTADHGAEAAVSAWLVGPEGIARCEVELVPGRDELFSRSRGLLETDVLSSRKVAVIGLGSGGAQIAVDLARSGVGRFVLIDFDRLELSNVSRHVCGVSDLGRFKTRAVRDAILERNPHAVVETHEADVNIDLERTASMLAGADLLMCATDQQRSRFNLNRFSIELGIPAIFGRALTRACGGDVLRVRPSQGPCLACVFGSGALKAEDEEISTVRQARDAAPAYTSAQEVQAVVHPGLSVDIAPISNMMVRLALVELSRGTTGAVTSLEADLEADLYIWANRRERSYSGFQPMGYAANRPAILRWYGTRAQRNPQCPECGELQDAAHLIG